MRVKAVYILKDVFEFMDIYPDGWDELLAEANRTGTILIEGWKKACNASEVSGSDGSTQQ